MSSMVDVSVWELQTWRNKKYESSNKVLEAVKCLFSEASINIPDACIDCTHRVSTNWWHSESMLYHISSPHFPFQEKEEIEE